ncbi:DNA-binding transcriptional regulator [Aeoliella sp. ICT_H6.2]|uniref:DNA-binding transcriptional regulator n=1 Tax=Aeoliella straminimaris TaxID=2954799 RepID=A0A9X2FA73_9BACT|nr:DNA-binding transcriptional regulator [Aeoliella straminimaris]MCO6044799.1 DNA-binding transcriptional regulator [Aeoliella straminimaris]
MATSIKDNPTLQQLQDPLRVARVAILIETESTWGRRVIRGIASYAEKHAAWHLLIDPRDHEHRSALPDGWRGHGVIARIASRMQYEQLSASGLPVVDVDDVFEDQLDIAKVITDEEARAKLALEHLSGRGLVNYAYFAPPSNRYSNRRGKAFAAAVQQAGYICHEYRPGYRAGRRISWNEQQRRVTRWLASLPRPVAILAVDAHHAHQIAEICHLADIRVPDEVAILAGDSDDLLCDVSMPPLSAISTASERIGYQAAELLASMMDGAPVPKEPIVVKPHDVVSRHSTDILSIDDPAVVQALRYIQDHAHRGIGVDDILREVPISRRSLEIQFRAYLDRSPAEEIRRAKLERGRTLLGKREMSITEVALASGFSNTTRFGIAFRKQYGMTPRSFRKTLFAE